MQTPAAPHSHPTRSTDPPGRTWHALETDEVFAALATSGVGLSANEASARLQSEGPNELVEKAAKGRLRILWEQFTSVMVLILFAASALSLGLGKLFEAGSILAIVVLFAVLGFFQEYRAERAIAALKRLAVPNVRVLRDGGRAEKSARELVRGDLIELEAGNVVPADARVVQSANMSVQEAALTGESEPIEKVTGALDGDNLPLGDRRNMVYMGTTVTYGRGVAVVTGTGMHTELGKIAGLLQDVRSEPTPLQGRLDSVGKQLALAGTVVAVLLLILNTAMGEPFADSLLTAISVAVAVIPEGLPAVVTVTLALGAQRMLRRNALIRKLPAVETLGSVTTICSDKTGTLTQNRMTVTMLGVTGFDVAVPGGRGIHAIDDFAPGRNAEMTLLLAGGALCNDAELRVREEPDTFDMIGDPTEGALLEAARRFGLEQPALQASMRRVAELPFDSVRKRMTTVHELPADPALRQALERAGLEPGHSHVAFTKGAVDGLLDVSPRALVRGTVVPLDGELRARILASNEGMAADGMRVLGVALRPLAGPGSLHDLEEDLVFIGITGMIDPPRPEVREAVAKCRTAGIRPVMITGDHPLTAASIARDLGISTDGRVVTGTQLVEMDDRELSREVVRTSVFARVSPEDKLRIVSALRGQGHVVAMTGDGVNDAPALKQADIGVAMGITGTDVSKEASDMVLRDDNFATIVAAVEEGRVIYDNLRRFVKFAVAGNIGKVLVMLAWPLLFIATGRSDEVAAALLPLQLLWLNLMTDGLLGLSMGVERAERNVMRRPPHNPKDGIFSGGMAWQVSWVGVAIGAITLAVGFWYYIEGREQWQSLMFTMLAFLQVFQALGSRSTTEWLPTVGIFSNRVMWLMIAVVVGLQFVLLYTPLGGFLDLEPLAAIDLVLCVAAGLLLLTVIELEKLWVRGRPATQRRDMVPQQ